MTKIDDRFPAEVRQENFLTAYSSMQEICTHLNADCFRLVTGDGLDFDERADTISLLRGVIDVVGVAASAMLRLSRSAFYTCNITVPEEVDDDHPF